MSELLRAGHTADRARELIYSANGQKLSVTAIIKRVIADKMFREHHGVRSLVH